MDISRQLYGNHTYMGIKQKKTTENRRTDLYGSLHPVFQVQTSVVPEDFMEAYSRPSHRE